MRDIQKLSSGEDVSCEDDQDMNFATFTTATGGHFITGTPMPMAKMQPTVATSNAAMPQVVSVVGGTDGVQYVRALDGGATLAPQLITLPITLPGTKPGDPQQTVQIQVLSPNIALQQPQPKYQMQIPIQGLQQGAVLTLAYAPETNDGVQIIRNAMPEGLQMVTLPQEMQVIQTQDSKDQLQMLQQQMVNAPQQQIVINNMAAMATDDKMINNNNIEQIIVKEECEEDTNDDSCQDMDCSEATASGEDLANYLQKVPSQSTASLPLSLQKFLILNTGERSAAAETGAQKHSIEIQIAPENRDDNIDDDAKVKKKKRYKKKSPKPAKPKPGQVVITTSKDGSPLYCCPECSLVYSEKEQLEVHLVVHKIERRFICGICGAGLKRKEHLERHKLGHNPERPYVCAVCRKGFKRREHLNLHTVIHSGVKTEMCLECGKGFYRKDHLRKHARSHESKRAREELLQGGGGGNGVEEKPGLGAVLHGDSAEITIHVPTSANVQVPVQINIPQHVVSSLSQAQFTNLTQHASTAATQHSAQATLDALLAQHT